MISRASSAIVFFLSSRSKADMLAAAAAAVVGEVDRFDRPAVELGSVPVTDGEGEAVACCLSETRIAGFNVGSCDRAGMSERRPPSFKRFEL